MLQTFSYNLLTSYKMFDNITVKEVQMKIASKVFIWISIIGASIAALVFFITGMIPLVKEVFVDSYIPIYILCRVFLPTVLSIVPIIVGIIALKKIKKATSKNQLTAIAIVSIILCSLLGGIFMLFIKDEELKN